MAIPAAEDPIDCSGELDLKVRPEPDASDAIHVLTISVQVQSTDRKHHLGIWSGLSLDPNLEHTAGRDSAFALFRESPAGISEARNLPLAVTAAPGTHAINIPSRCFQIF